MQELETGLAPAARRRGGQRTQHPHPRTRPPPRPHHTWPQQLLALPLVGGTGAAEADRPPAGAGLPVLQEGVRRAVRRDPVAELGQVALAQGLPARVSGAAQLAILAAAVPRGAFGPRHQLAAAAVAAGIGALLPAEGLR